jgi:hypothetical protein
METNAHFKQGVKANVELKSSIPIQAFLKVEIDFRLGVKAKIEKLFQFAPSYQ